MWETGEASVMEWNIAEMQVRTSVPLRDSWHYNIICSIILKSNLLGHVLALYAEKVMYSLIKALPRRELTLRQLPALVTSLAIAETFYKFHSFLLESVAFLATWFLIDAASHLFWPSKDPVRSGPNPS